jgi:iron complex outermembrane receptor protein
MRDVIHLTVAMGILILVPGLARAAPGPNQAPEDLLFQEIPVVITSTRTEQSMLDVPDAVTVITAEEIRDSGATSLTEVFAWVPGLEFMRNSATDVNMSMRGFNKAASSMVLAMIDGRTVYEDFFGVVSWDRLDVTLHDIERIEVIRGPGSALYGANAFLGTVNIITKKARDLPRAHIQVGAGVRGSLVSATGGYTTERAAIKGSLQYRSQDHYRNEMGGSVTVPHRRDDTGLREQKFNATLEYRLSDDTDITLSGGGARLKADIMTDVTTFGYEGPKYYAVLDLNKGPWKFQTFMEHLDLDISALPGAILGGTPLFINDRIQSTTLDFEVQREFSFLKHQFVVGWNSRRLVTDAPVVLGSREAETLHAFFVHDEYAITDSITGFIGARIDDHPKSGVSVSPRASLVFRVGEDSRIRASFARSFRNPTQIENYIALQTQTGPPVTIRGEEDLDPIWVTAYGVGFEHMFGSSLRARLDLFYNVLEDHKVFNLTSLAPPTLSWRNMDRTAIRGAELALEFKILENLRGFANYSAQSAYGPHEGVTPRHKGSAGLRGNLGSRTRFAITGVVMGHTRMEPGPSVSLPDRTVPSRFTVDTFLGVKLLPQFELGLHAKNLFNQVRSHHPMGDEIGSELMVTGTWEF